MSQPNVNIFAKPVATRLVFETLFAKQPESECWLWKGGVFARRGGYGAFTCRWLGVQMMRAHRASWMIYKRQLLQADQHVLHRCDNPKCVNPDHLFLGDQAINMADKTRKGRQNRGERHGKAKLTESAVLGIRADTRLLREIAADHGITIASVCDIQKRRSWMHI